MRRAWPGDGAEPADAGKATASWASGPVTRTTQTVTVTNLGTSPIYFEAIEVLDVPSANALATGQHDITDVGLVYRGNGWAPAIGATAIGGKYVTTANGTEVIEFVVNSDDSPTVTVYYAQYSGGPTMD